MTPQEQFLKTYLDTCAPTGFEMPGQKVWLNYLKPYIDEFHIDNYGTAYGVINPGQNYRVVIEAHADEISWFVNFISDDGYLSVIRNGGSDAAIAPSMRVNLHTPSGMVKGVFGWPAIHVRQTPETDPKPSLDNIFIDVGAASKAEVLQMGINIGTVATFEDDFMFFNNHWYVGRALDNRMGGYCIAEVARKLSENNIKLPYSLYIVNAVQEEVGLRGAEMITRTINPHVALITDVTHDTSTPLMAPKKQGDIKCGKGPALTYGPAVHNKLLDLIIEAANQNAIPYQRRAVSRSTGTDTDAFAYSMAGCPSALISLPLKYMHTTVETCHKLDVENVVELIYQTLLKIENNHNFKYF